MGPTALRLLPGALIAPRALVLAAAVALPLAACQSDDESAISTQQRVTQTQTAAARGSEDQTVTPASLRAGRKIDRLSDRAIALLTGQSLSEADRLDRFRALLRRNFAINQIGRLILNGHWGGATADQRRRYLRLFEEWVVQTYGGRFREYSGQTIEVVGTYETEQGDRFVQTDIIEQNGNVVRVDWRLRDVAGEDKIIDVMVAGTSMVITQRSEFGAVIDREGGVEGLITTLRQRLLEQG